MFLSLASSCRFRKPQWLDRFLLLTGLLASFAFSARAQAAPSVGYTFLTLTTSESQSKTFARILIAPAFQGKSEIQLETFGGMASNARNLDKLQRNTLLVNQQLEALTGAGWGLVQVYPVADTGVLMTRYLFREGK